MTHLIKLTEKEIEMLETWKKLVENGERTKMNQKAAILLNIAEGTVRSRLSRLKSKYEYGLDLVRRYRSYQQFFVQKTGGKFNPLSRSGRGRR